MKKQYKSQHHSRQGSPSNKQAKEQLIKEQLSSIQSNIAQKLVQNELTIPQQKIPFLRESQKNEKEQKHYKQLMTQKKQMEQKLKQLQKEQQSYVQKNNCQEVEQKQIQIQKQIISQRNKIGTNVFKRKINKYSQSIQENSDNNNNKQQEFNYFKSLQEQEGQPQPVVAKHQQQKQQRIKIKQRFRSLQSHKSSRQTTKKYTECTQNQVSKIKRLHDILHENWQKKNNQEAIKKYKLMEERNKQKYINFIQLKEHQKKYKQIIKQKKKQLQQKRNSLTLLTQNKDIVANRSTSKVYTKLIEQQKQLRQAQNKKKQIKKLLLLKQLQYSEQLRGQLAPKIKPISQPEVQQDQQFKLAPLTHQQIKQLGNQYLTQGNKKIKKRQLNQLTSNIANQHLPPPINPKKRDYLTETRIRKQQQNRNTTCSPKQQAQKIMKDESLTMEDKIGKLKFLATKFDSNNTDIVKKIQTKLEILKAIY